MRTKSDWSKQTILLTGGTGSFGKKFTEVMLKVYKPKKLIIFSRDEFKQYEMQKQFVNFRDCCFMLNIVLNENKSKIEGYTQGKKSVLISYGFFDFMLNPKWKIKARYEGLDDDDDSADTISGAYQFGIDYWIGKKTALMLEYQNIKGEGTVKDKDEL